MAISTSRNDDDDDGHLSDTAPVSCDCGRYGALPQLCARRSVILSAVARAKSRKRERTSACLRARTHAHRELLSAATPDPRPVPRPALLSLDDAVQHRGGSPTPSGHCIMKCTTGAMRRWKRKVMAVCGASTLGCSCARNGACSWSMSSLARAACSAHAAWRRGAIAGWRRDVVPSGV